MKLLKRWYKNSLLNMEKSNKESYGDKKLDCCGLNSNKTKKSKSSYDKE